MSNDTNGTEDDILWEKNHEEKSSSSGQRIGMTTDLFVTFYCISTLILLETICPASSHETFQLLEFPLNGLQAHGKLHPVVGLLLLASGQICFRMAFPPFLIKQLYFFHS